MIQAKKTLEKELKCFDEAPTADVAEQADTLVKTSLITWSEAKLFEAPELASLDKAAAVVEISTVVQLWNEFHSAKDVPITTSDIYSVLWIGYQRVNKGLNPDDPV